MPKSYSRPQQSADGPVTWPQPPVSRRALLRGLGTGAALAAAPGLLTSAHAGAATTAGPGSLTLATRGGRHGATLELGAFPPGTTWAEAIADWERYTGTTIKASKVFVPPRVFPTSISSEISTFIRRGIKALLSFKPACDPPVKTDLAALDRTLQMYRNAGLTAAVTLWQETEQRVMTPYRFRRVFEYYGPAVRKYYPLVFDAPGSGGHTNWTDYYPGDSLVDAVAVDYYATAYVAGNRLDAIAAIADQANPPKPFGIWEMGNGGATPSPTKTQVRSYFSYIQSLMAGRLQAGKRNAAMVWYNGTGPSMICSSSDYRVPLWDSLVTTTSRNHPPLATPAGPR